MAETSRQRDPRPQRSALPSSVARTPTRWLRPTRVARHSPLSQEKPWLKRFGPPRRRNIVMAPAKNAMPAEPPHRCRQDHHYRAYSVPPVRTIRSRPRQRLHHGLHGAGAGTWYHHPSPLPPASGAVSPDTRASSQINIIDTWPWTSRPEWSAPCVCSMAPLPCSTARRRGAAVETVWRQADKYGVPRICFINKMDKLGASTPSRGWATPSAADTIKVEEETGRYSGRPQGCDRKLMNKFFSRSRSRSPSPSLPDLLRFPLALSTSDYLPSPEDVPAMLQGPRDRPQAGDRSVLGSGLRSPTRSAPRSSCAHRVRRRNVSTPPDDPGRPQGQSAPSRSDHPRNRTTEPKVKLVAGRSRCRSRRRAHPQVLRGRRPVKFDIPRTGVRKLAIATAAFIDPIGSRCQGQGRSASPLDGRRQGHRHH